MTNVMLVGTDLALLEGLAQSLARLGHRPAVTTSFAEAADLAAIHPPLVLVADRSMASSAGAEMAVLADLTLPLERHRLAALVQSIADRARTTGRAPRTTPPETRL